MKPRKIYAASSWRNTYYTGAVADLQHMGHEVYDFRNDKTHFEWRTLSPDFANWTRQEYLDALQHSKSQKGFIADFSFLEWCDTCVLILPCNRSAHLEAGWAKGSGRDLFIYLPNDESFEPELMYLMADDIVMDMDTLERALYRSNDDYLFT